MSVFIFNDFHGYGRVYLGDGWINPSPQNSDDTAVELGK